MLKTGTWLTFAALVVAGAGCTNQEVREGRSLLRMVDIPDELVMKGEILDGTTPVIHFLAPARAITPDDIGVPSGFHRVSDLTTFENYELTSGWDVLGYWEEETDQGLDHCFIMLERARELQDIVTPLSDSEVQSVASGRRSLISLSAGCIEDV